MVAMRPRMRIGARKVGAGQPAFIVAELSGNHHQSYDEAAELIRAAARAGADAVKLQTYTPDTMTLDSDRPWFVVGGGDNPDSWKGKTLYQLYREAYTPWEWQPKLKRLAESLGLILFSTPFDETAVDFLEKMEVPCYKIASYEATHIPLLRRVAATGKPVLLSIGFADPKEVESALQTLRSGGAGKIALLHCVTSYAGEPRPEDMHLATLRDIERRFGVVAGFSDNTGGIEMPLAAVLSGASILEKHFILRRSKGGHDARFSIEPQELAALVRAIRRAEKALGQPHYGPANEAETYNKRFRRSLFAVQDIRRGERLTRENVRVIRPADGLPPRLLERVLGKSAARDIPRGTPLSLSLILGGGRTS